MSKFEAGRYLCFTIGTEKFAIPLLQVKEVIGITEIRNVPLSPKYFLGILNLRGQVISIVDLRIKLGITKSSNSDENSIIILEMEGVYFGVVVDSVDSVTPFTEEQMSEPPIREGVSNVDYISAVARFETSMTLVIDMMKIFNLEEMKRTSGHSAGTSEEPPAQDQISSESLQKAA